MSVRRFVGTEWRSTAAGGKKTKIRHRPAEEEERDGKGASLED